MKRYYVSLGKFPVALPVYIYAEMNKSEEPDLLATRCTVEPNTVFVDPHFAASFMLPLWCLEF